MKKYKRNRFAKLYLGILVKRTLTFEVLALILVLNRTGSQLEGCLQRADSR